MLTHPILAPLCAARIAQQPCLPHLSLETLPNEVHAIITQKYAAHCYIEESSKQDRQAFCCTLFIIEVSRTSANFNTNVRFLKALLHPHLVDSPITVVNKQCFYPQRNLSFG